MPSIYKTIFVPTHPEKKTSVFKLIATVDGTQLARDLQAAIEEMEYKGYEILFVEPVNASVPFKGSHRTGNSGMILIFRKLVES